MSATEGGFPVPPPEDAEPPRRQRGFAKGSPEAKAVAAKASETKRRKREGKAGDAASTREREIGAAVASATPAALREVRNNIADAMRKAGALSTMAVPVTGTYCIETADEFADALTRLAADNPKLLKALVGSSNVMDWFALGAWGVGLLTAVGVEFGRLPADGVLAQQYGVDKLADAFYPRGAEPAGGDDGGQPGADPVGGDGADPAGVLATR